MCARSMTQEAEDWKQVSEQAELEMQHATSDENIALSLNARVASSSTDAMLSTRLPHAVGTAAKRISLQVRLQ